MKDMETLYKENNYEYLTDLSLHYIQCDYENKDGWVAYNKNSIINEIIILDQNRNTQIKKWLTVDDIPKEIIDGPNREYIKNLIPSNTHQYIDIDVMFLKPVFHDNQDGDITIEVKISFNNTNYICWVRHYENPEDCQD